MSSTCAQFDLCICKFGNMAALIFQSLNSRPKNPRIQRTRKDPLKLPDDLLIAEYRLPEHVILQLCSLLEDDLTPQRTGDLYLSLQDKVLISLKLLASGGLQRVAKDYVDEAQSTVC